ncbi:MAG: hypothetical protein J1G06_00960 [Oscillospiraceae bacterium]|nr:hypothetical protein [Oscillospiraceae bacterium]
MKKRVKIPLIILLIAALFASDLYLTHNNFIVNSNIFIQNDFEITQHDHPEKVWDKVFFGNSVVISAYIEDKSSSGYINCGLDYGVVTDLWEMLDKKYIRVGSELVVGLNYLTLYDDFDTNPTYIWHKKWYQPYAYFERDRFYPLVTDAFTKALKGDFSPPMTYKKQEKAVYHGKVSEAALADKFEEYQEEFFNKPIEKYSENLNALEKVIDYCNKNNIRLRVVWMPWNPIFEQPKLVKEVRTETDKILNKNNIETLDLEDKFGSEYFYDTGHLNYDTGSERFTKIIDEWL